LADEGDYHLPTSLMQRSYALSIAVITAGVKPPLASY